MPRFVVIQIAAIKLRNNSILFESNNVDGFFKFVKPSRHILAKHQKTSVIILKIDYKAKTSCVCFNDRIDDDEILVF